MGTGSHNATLSKATILSFKLNLNQYDGCVTFRDLVYALVEPAVPHIDPHNGSDFLKTMISTSKVARVIDDHTRAQEVWRQEHPDQMDFKTYVAGWTLKKFWQHKKERREVIANFLALRESTDMRMDSGGQLRPRWAPRANRKGRKSATSMNQNGENSFEDGDQVVALQPSKIGYILTDKGEVKDPSLEC